MTESAENKALYAYMDAMEMLEDDKLSPAAMMRLDITIRDLGSQGISPEEAHIMLDEAKAKVDQARQTLEDIFSDE